MPGFRFNNREGKIHYGATTVLDAYNLTPPSSLTLNPDVASGFEDNALSGNVLQNDIATTGTLTATQFTVAGVTGIFAVGQPCDIPSTGRFTLAATGAWTFTPSPDWNGEVPLITYQATNGTDVKQSTLTITIIAVNDAPRSIGDFATTIINTPVVFWPLENDSDIDAGSSISIVEVNGIGISVGESITLANGSLTLNANQSFTFMPTLDFVGDFTVPYTLSDGALMSTSYFHLQVTNPARGLGSPIFDHLYDVSWVADEGTAAVTQPAVTAPAKSENLFVGGYTDPAFNVEVRKLVSIVDAPDATVTNFRHDYSRRQVYNADGSRMLMKASNGFWYQFDAISLELIYSGRIGPPGNGAIPGLAGGCDPIWHPTDRAKLAYTARNGGLIWYVRDVFTHTTSVLFDLTPKFQEMGGVWLNARKAYFKGEGRPSHDWNRWALMVNDQNDIHIGLIMYDLGLDQIIGSVVVGGTNPPDHISTSFTGEYAVPSWYTSAAANMADEQAAPITQARGARAYTADFSSFTALSVLGEHSDLAYYIDENDEIVEVLVAISLHGTADGLTRDTIFVRRLDGGGTWEIPFLPFNGGTGDGFHISGTCTSRPGFVVLSKYSGVGNGSYDGQIVVAEIQPPTMERPAKLYRLAHHRSTGSPYEAEPHATPNQDLTRIVFASNFDGSNELVSYALILPSDAFPVAGSSAPQRTASPSVSGTYAADGTISRVLGSYVGVPTPIVSGAWETSADGTTWTAIAPAATGSTYVIPSGTPNGVYYRWFESATNVGGTLSTASNVIVTAPLSATANTVAPSINPTGNVGTAMVGDAGTWTGNPAPTLAFMWQRNVSGTWTDSSFTVLSPTLDVAGEWRLRVTGSNNQGPDVVAYSNTSTVELPASEPTPTTIVTFNQANGTTLEAIDADWFGDSTSYAVTDSTMRAAGNGYTEGTVLLGKTIGNNQAAQFTLAAGGGAWAEGGEQAYLYANNSGGNNFYQVRVLPGSIQLYRGTTLSGSQSHGFDIPASGITVRMTTFAGRVRVYLNGSSTPSIDYTDTTPLTGGYPGFGIFANGVPANVTISDFRHNGEASTGAPSDEVFLTDSNGNFLTDSNGNFLTTQQ
jgi:hypothetical protein